MCMCVYVFAEMLTKSLLFVLFILAMLCLAETVFRLVLFGVRTEVCMCVAVCCELLDGVGYDEEYTTR